MKNVSLSSSSKETILEMVRRYKISVGTKRYDELFHLEINQVYIVFLFLIIFSSFLSVGLYLILGSNVSNIFRVLCPLLFVVSLCTFVHSMLERCWRSFQIYLKFNVFNSFSRFLNRIKKRRAIKTNEQLEFNLKKNYEEIKIWFECNESVDTLNNIIEEMKFPSEITRYVNVNSIIEKIESQELNNKVMIPSNGSNFVSMDELDKMLENKEIDKGFKFFEKTG